MLIDTLVRFIARSSAGLQEGLDQILRRTSDELLEFLYEDAWARMQSAVQEVFMVLVSLANPLDGKCVADACAEVGVQHAEFQSSLGETYFASIVDNAESYDLEIVELAKEFFRKKKKKVPEDRRALIEKIAFAVDKRATTRQEINRNYRQDRVADAFRSEYAKAAKISTIKKDYDGAIQLYELAILDEPLNAALQERFASFLFRTLGNAPRALPFAVKATELDPHSGDAWLTQALIQYKLGKLEAGEECINKAEKNGKTEQLCLLQRGIARFHLARKEPYGKRSMSLLREAESLVGQSTRSNSHRDFYFSKNKAEAEKYLSLIRTLVARINRREVITEVGFSTSE